MGSVERDPNKRRVKPVEQACVLDFDEESSDDSDFRIEDHPEVSDDDDNDEDDDDDEADLLHSSSNENDHPVSSGMESDGDLGIEKAKELSGLRLSNANELSPITDIIEKAKIQSKLNFNEHNANMLICCGCLGDHSDGINEIVECDSCGVTVHEACYGVSDSTSLSSTDSLSPTAPWFCESCRAGVMEPVCELCPNSGGIFKETDVGKWVHLICALYVPGVAFGEVDKLTSVTLFEMPYSKWGSKSCSLCSDEKFARTGVCIGCDAGLCRTYFHVTCAQREGFLSEAHSEEVDQADPFYAHCKLHSDKILVKRRKRNYLALQMRMHYRKLQFEKEGSADTPEQVRIRRKLAKQKLHYLDYKKKKPPPWVPTQKMPRLITTSATACRKLILKAELMGINTLALEMSENQVAALTDIRRKWHIPPAFTVEFISYYLDRNERLKEMKRSLENLVGDNKTLLDEQHQLRTKYEETLNKSSDITGKNAELKATINTINAAILSICPMKILPDIDDLEKLFVPKTAPQPMMVPTAAALKMGVGFPLQNIPSGRNDRVLSNQVKSPAEPLRLNECGICRQKRDQHMLAKCDTCHLYYHLNCLNPPLSRLPKKSKLYGWQCSECDKTSDSEIEEVKSPRKSRSIYSRKNRKDPNSPPKLKIKPLEPVETSHDLHQQQQDLSPLAVDNVPQKIKKNRRHSAIVVQKTSQPETDSQQIIKIDNKPPTEIEINKSNSSEGANLDNSDQRNTEEQDNVLTVVRNGYESYKAAKKRRREKHRNKYSPETYSGKEHKRKRKKKSVEVAEEPLPHPRITIKIKSIPLPEGEVASESNPQCFYVPNEADDNAPPPILPSSSSSSSSKVTSGRKMGSKQHKIKKNRSSLSLSDRSSSKDNIMSSPPINTDGSIEAQDQSNISAFRTGSSRRNIEQPFVKMAVVSCNEYNTLCDVCRENGTTRNSVRCDECHKLYHFLCLDPPLKSTPKKRGYSWHCADCDPTASD